MTVELYQNVVIGSGEGGKILAWNLAKKSQKTIVVERSMIGGSCPNVACLPSKNVIYSAKAVSLVDPQHGAQVPVLGQMFMIFGTLTYLAINGHLMLIRPSAAFTSRRRRLRCLSRPRRSLPSFR